jgi:predicted permease
LRPCTLFFTGLNARASSRAAGSKLLDNAEGGITSLRAKAERDWPSSAKAGALSWPHCGEQAESKMPDFKKYVRESLPPLRVSGAREAEIIEELALQFQEAYERAIRNGVSTEEAWAEARNRVASWTELGQELQSALHEPLERDPRPRRSTMARFFDDSLRDLRFAVRQLWKGPGFTMVAVLTLALGIGANTAIFSLLDAVLLRHLPVRQPEQLLWFGPAHASGSTKFIPNGNTQAFSYLFFQDFRRKNHVFSDVAAIRSTVFETHGRVAGNTDLEKIDVELVSGTYFQTLGVKPVLGRALGESDDQEPGAHPVAVASYSWWERRFANDPSLIGKPVAINSTVYTVVGVASRGFFGATVGHSPDLWIPLAMDKEISPAWTGLDDSFFQTLHIVARPKPGVTLSQAQAETNFLFRDLIRGYLGSQPTKEELDNIEHAYIQLTPAATGRSAVRQFSSPLQVLMVVVALVLLIACANVANLLLVRATGRRREIAVRMSMGAKRSRLIQQLFAESALLGLLGTLLGVALAWGASRLLLSMVSTGAELLAIRVSPDPAVLGFTGGVAFLTVLLFGTVPAFQATRFDLVPSLQGGRSVISAPTRSRLARGLVVAQVTLSLVLLAGAGLFLRSLSNLFNLDTGFDKRNVLVMNMDPAAAGYLPDARLESMMERIEERVAAIPGAEGASFALDVFDDGGWSENDIEVPGQPETNYHPGVDFNIVGPEYLSVMRMPLLLGRGLTAHDAGGTRKVAVINETMARRYFSGGSPLGRTFSTGDDPQWHDVEVVGVVKDAKYMELEEEQKPAVFYPHAQHRRNFLETFVVRYEGNPSALFPEIKNALSEIDPNLPVSDVTTLVQRVDDSVLNMRLVAQLSSFFGALAAFLACIGIYGLMSYGIARRTNEFGIRMALGAERYQVLCVVLWETLLLAIAGVAIGLGLSLASGRLVESLLFGLKPYDPLVLALATVAMIVVALLAGFLPARRATRIDPWSALRYE